MANSILIDDVLIKEYGLYLEGRPPIPTAEQDTEHIEIRGRHGSLTKKYGFKDIEYPLPMFFYRDLPFKKYFRLAKVMLFNGKKLVFDDDPDIYYKIKSVVIDTAENDVLRFGKFTAVFTLAPFGYEINNPIQTITARAAINNPSYESEPIMTVHSAGTGKVYVNDEEITIQNINGTITIDSEMMNAYRNRENLNNHMIGDFPVLQHGENVIKFDGNISKIELIKNWRWV